MDIPDDAIETSASTIWIDDQIVHVRSRGVTSTRESITEAAGAIRDLTGETLRPLLFDARQWPRADPEVWMTIITNLQSTTTALAILIDPESPTELGEYPAIIDRLLIPFRTFTDETEALAFLKRDRDAS